MQTAAGEDLITNEVEEQLLHVLTNRELKTVKFKTICDNLKWPGTDRCVFGAAGSSLRRACQKRREHLLRDGKLATALRNFRKAPQDQSQESPPSPFPLSLSPAATHRFASSTPPKTPRPAKMVLTSDQVFAGHIYQLYFGETWKNPLQITSTREDKILQPDGERVDKARLEVPIWDARDARNGLVKANFNEDGTGILFQQACTGQTLRDPDNNDNISSLVDQEWDPVTETRTGQIDERMKNAKKAHTIDMQDEDCLTVVYLLKFPPGITCNNHYFNNASDGARPTDEHYLRLKWGTDKYKFGQKGGQPVNNFNAFFALEMAIDVDSKAGRSTKLKQKKDADEAARMMGGLGLDG